MREPGGGSQAELRSCSAARPATQRVLATSNTTSEFLVSLARSFYWDWSNILHSEGEVRQEKAGQARLTPTPSLISDCLLPGPQIRGRQPDLLVLIPTDLRSKNQHKNRELSVNKAVLNRRVILHPTPVLLCLL